MLPVLAVDDGVDDGGGDGDGEAVEPCVMNEGDDVDVDIRAPCDAGVADDGDNDDAAAVVVDVEYAEGREPVDAEPDGGRCKVVVPKPEEVGGDSGSRMMLFGRKSSTGLSPGSKF